MKDYIEQLLSDLDYAAKNISFPFVEKELSLHNWISPEKEEVTAPVRNLESWTGITSEMLPPQTLLTDEQINQLLTSLNKLLSASNCEFVLQTKVPHRIQYETIRLNFNQEVKVKQWNMGFFEMCQPDTPHKTCALGEHCQCAFYAEFFDGMIDEDLTPEQERARALEIEVQHIKSKYGNEWMKYYPYHLDPEYDDENGSPFNYGFDVDDEDEDKPWWKQK